MELQLPLQLEQVTGGKYIERLFLMDTKHDVTVGELFPFSGVIKKEQIEDAKIILKACNNYEKLVEYAKELLTIANKFAPAEEMFNVSKIEEFIKNLEA